MNYVERIFLKKIEKSDYEEYYKIRSEKKNLFWTGYEKAPDFENFKNFFNQRVIDINRNIYLLYIDEVCVGALHIDYYDDYATFGYSVKEKYEGKGIGHLFNAYTVNIIKMTKIERSNISRIIGWVNCNNKASIKILEKNGFIKSDKTEMRNHLGNQVLYFMYYLNI